jgi:hypothetical protein
MKHFTFIVLFLLSIGFVSGQNSATFEELTLGSNGFWNGSDGSGKFTSGPFTFHNSYNAEWASWRGFSFTNHTDSVTPGWMNQYSAIAGSGVGGSAIYAVAYVSGTTRITLSNPDSLAGFYVTNSTYAYLSMRDGDDYTKKFGGSSGNDPDYFRLVVEGIDEEGDTTGTVMFYLADFRAEENDKDYIVNSWKWVDLTSLGVVSELHFSLESTDMGAWGMNTPAYFCLDNLNRKDITSSLTRKVPPIADILVFPNPFRQDLAIQLPEGNFRIELRDIQGRLLFNWQENGNQTWIPHEINSINNGVYLLTFRNQQGLSQTVKIQKNN